MIFLILECKRFDSDIDKLQQLVMKLNRDIAIIQEIIESNKIKPEKTVD